MAIVKRCKFPVDEITGTLGATDRTRARDPGLAVTLTKSRHSEMLKKKTQTPIARSEAFEERTKIYCACDVEYKEMSETKREYTNTYYRAAHDLSSITITNYQTWMKLCLSALPEKAAFKEFSWLARYQVQNNTPEAWTDKIVRLIDINTKRGDGKDLQAFRIDTKKNILLELEHKVDAPGSTYIKIPFLDTQVSFLADVYSFSDYIHYEAW